MGGHRHVSLGRNRRFQCHNKRWFTARKGRLDIGLQAHVCTRSYKLGVSISRCCSGRVSTKVLPSPGVDSARICPPCRSTMRRQSVRPIPVPSYLSAECSRLKSSKIRSAYALSNPIPLSRKSEFPHRVIFHVVSLCREFYLEWHVGAPVLERIVDQILHQQFHLRRVGHDRRQFVARKMRACRVLALERIPDAADYRAQRWARESLASLPELRQLKQISDEMVHSVHPARHVLQPPVGALIQIPVVALGQKMRVARNSAKRLLQVVRRDVGERLKILVRSLEIVAVTRKSFLHFLAPCNVVELNHEVRWPIRYVNERGRRLHP